MHPAGSVILFTVASGLGFGMLTWLGLGLPDARGWAAFFHSAVAFALAGGGFWPRPSIWEIHRGS
jgi:DMSO reductase anchor subunit